MTTYYKSVNSRPEPDEDIEVNQRKLADVIIDTDAETISLVTPTGDVLYRATWELWALQLLVHQC